MEPKTHKVGAREKAQWLDWGLPFQRIGVWFPAPKPQCSQAAIPTPGDLTASSGLIIYIHCYTLIHKGVHTQKDGRKT